MAMQTPGPARFAKWWDVQSPRPALAAPQLVGVRVDGQTPGHDRIESERIAADRPRALGRARRQRARHRRRRRGRRARRGRRRRPLPGLRRRHRLPEPRPQPRGRGPRDPRAGRPVPAPVLHGRGLRALCGRLPQARRAVSLSGHRPEEHPLQLRRRGGRERRQDRARQDRAAGDHRVRPRLPRPHADDDDADVARSSRTRRASGRSRPRSTARRRRTRTGASAATTRSRRWSSCSSRTSIRAPSRQ